MAAIATLVLVEKTVRGHLVSRVVGAGLIVGGWLLMLPMSALGHWRTSGIVVVIVLMSLVSEVICSFSGKKSR
jgi:hypothetical protein